MEPCLGSAEEQAIAFKIVKSYCIMLGVSFKIDTEKVNYKYKEYDYKQGYGVFYNGDISLVG